MVATNYRGRRPPGAPGSQKLGPWCTWLLCAHCGESTVHAVVVDALADRWRQEGCDREQRDRRTDRHRRRLERRLRALAADGVGVIRASSNEDMNLDEAIIEVIEYADPRCFIIRICATADPTCLLGALDIAEDLLDEPGQLGPWADDRDGVWRGVAIMDSPR